MQITTRYSSKNNNLSLDLRYRFNISNVISSIWNIFIPNYKMITNKKSSKSKNKKSNNKKSNKSWWTILTNYFF